MTPKRYEVVENADGTIDIVSHQDDDTADDIMTLAKMLIERFAVDEGRKPS